MPLERCDVEKENNPLTKALGNVFNEIIDHINEIEPKIAHSLFKHSKSIECLEARLAALEHPVERLSEEDPEKFYCPDCQCYHADLLK